jgi:hypothetical protein
LSRIVAIPRVDLELRSGRVSHAWSALVGFAARRQRGLWGQMGFLEHFVATFDTPGRLLTLRPNGTFPPPLHAVEGDQE